jgi:hypothetical protein
MEDRDKRKEVWIRIDEMLVMRTYERIEDGDDHPILRWESWKSMKSSENRGFVNI